MINPRYSDWGEASEEFDYLAETVAGKNLSEENEAQTRYDVIDRLVRDVFGWRYGSVQVEEYAEGPKRGYIDYVLRLGDSTIVIEAKRLGASFPSPTKKSRLKLSGTVLSTGAIGEAIEQASSYATSVNADVAVVTNGRAWCLFAMRPKENDGHATMAFPFDEEGHAERLFNLLSASRVELGSLEELTLAPPVPEDRLLSVVSDADSRVDRNRIADHISPALERAMLATALLTDEEALRHCFVTTDARTRFDQQLGVHLADPKPEVVAPARRVRRSRTPRPLDEIIESSQPAFAPPVTLIIGPVGAGKSTYLSHFAQIAGRDILDRARAHWIYIDFEELGRGGDPRAFLYAKLREYLTAEHPESPTDFAGLVQPAYEEEFKRLKRGPLALLAADKAALKTKLSSVIEREFEQVEPYVDRLLRHLAARQLCIVVLDNADLYEDSELEASVFSEGLALSKRVKSHVIVSIRDTTFVKHRAGSVFDAYELRRLWVDPPPFPAVLSARLSYSKQILKNRSAKIRMRNGINLNVPDLSRFFDVVQSSVLGGDAGRFIEASAGLNIRRGLGLVSSFLTSGHVEADRALKQYIEGDSGYHIPFHELFKGTMLGQWAHYKEARANCLNLFDARLGSRRLRLLRLFLLQHLYTQARNENTMECPVTDCVQLLSYMGASEDQVAQVAQDLQRGALLRNVTPERELLRGTVVISRTGAYYVTALIRKFVYVESCMFDTAIEEPAAWERIVDITHSIEGEPSPLLGMQRRRERIEIFLEYVAGLEAEASELLPVGTYSPLMRECMREAMEDADRAVSSAERGHQRRVRRMRKK